jgi:methionine synthase II (cobalamin-independent)
MSASIEAIRWQKEIGLDRLSGGKLRRRNFISDLMEALAGFDS